MGDRRVITLAHDGHTRALHVTTGNGPSAAVLLLPALGVPARKYFALADELAGRGLAAGVLDLRGQGDSRPHPSRDDRYGYAELTTDVSVAVAALRADAGVSRVVLLGHSLGGQLALIHTALFEPLDVILVGVALPYWRDYSGPYRLALLPMSQTVAVIATALRVSPSWSFGGAQSRGVMHDWAATARNGRWPAIAGVDPLRRLGRVPFRLLAVHVQNDEYAPPAATKRLLVASAAADVETFGYAEDLAGASLDHFSWLRACGPLADRVVSFVEG
jgi:predicted alpha/beta hydrolase